MIKRTKLVRLVLLLLVLTLPLGGCYDYSELDERIWVLALGVDKGRDDHHIVTAVVPIPKNIDGGGEGSGGKGEGFMTVTVETASVISTAEAIDAMVDRRVDFTHAKWIVFSRELAEEGVTRYLGTLARYDQIWRLSNIVVCEGTAQEFLTKAKPKLEDNVGKYYELLQRGWRYTGFIPTDHFYQFFAKDREPGVQPIAMLAAINDPESASLETEVPKSMEYYSANNIPHEGGGAVRLMGGAVFNRGRMVGVLDSGNVSVQKMLFGKLKYTIIDIPDPKHPGYFIIANIKQRAKPRVIIQVEQDYPRIVLDFQLEGEVLGIQSGENYTKSDQVHIVEKAASEMLRDTISRTVAKSQDMGVDFLGLGLHAKKSFATWPQWVNYQWDEKYPDAVVDIQVDYKVRGTGLVHEMTPQQ